MKNNSTSYILSFTFFSSSSFSFYETVFQLKRKFREIFLSCTGIKSRETVVRVYNCNRNRNFAIMNLKKKENEIMIGQQEMPQLI